MTRPMGIPFGRVISSGKSIVETLKTRGTFDLGGNLISRQIYEEMRTFDPWRAPGRLPAHALIVGFLGDTTKATDLQAIARMYPGAELALIKEHAVWFDKNFQNPTTLYETTARWLERVLADHRAPPRPHATREGRGTVTGA